MSQDDSPGFRGRPERGLEAASSAELIRFVQGGEPRALQILFERYRPILRRWAAGRLPRWARDLVDTDDMVQDALMGTMRNLHRFEPRHAGAFGAYLRQALNNRIRDEVRKARARPQRAEMPVDHPADGASPLEQAIGREAMARYEAALEGLTDVERELVVARLEMGLGYAEIAEATGKPSADAARMAVARALVRMAKAMGA
jgi:RNA polymerase sigma-70 factor, ECF subfamily